MTLLSSVRKFPGVLVAMLAIAAVMVISQPARSYTGSIGWAAKVQAVPTVGLTDGQAIAVHVEGINDLTLYDVQAHLCQAGAGIKNGFEFDFDGPYCSPSKVSPAADTAIEQKVSGGSTDLTFHVGVGTGAPWSETDGGTHTLTCGPGAPCDLVLQVAVNGANVFHAIPLCFGDGCGPEPTGAAPAAGGSTSDNGTGSKSAAAASTSGASNGAPPAPSASGGNHAGPGAGARGAQATTPGAEGDPRVSASGSPSHGNGAASARGSSEALAVPASASSASPVATWRIALAGLAGLLCGARIVSVLGRARKRAQMGVA